jgi:hypothetical protein
MVYTSTKVEIDIIITSIKVTCSSHDINIAENFGLLGIKQQSVACISILLGVFVVVIVW